MEKPTCAKCGKEDPEIELVIRDNGNEQLHEYFCSYKHLTEWCEQWVCEHW